jgi:SET domain-containing protein
MAGKGGARPESAIRRRVSPIHGSGVFATRAIRKGTRIVEYRGERITPEEAADRYDDEDDESPHVLLFSINARLVVDAGVGGNVARFVNHCCEPNCEPVLVDERIYLEALRDIAPGEELTYDYHLQRHGRYGPRWEARYACRCGARGCRGTMLAPVRKRTGKGKGKGKGRA